MPTYDYVCRNCGHRLEVVHGIFESGPTVCPVCGGELRKGMSAPSIVFKGSGWAKKDRSSTSTAAKSTTDSDKPASTPAGPSTDKSSGGEATKPAASTSSEPS